MGAIETTPTLAIRLLGGCDIRNAGVAVRLETAKTSALLAYLILQPGAHERHKLIGLLWASLPEAKAHRALRHALWDLRRSICVTRSSTLLDINLHTVAFIQQPDCWVDVLDFQQRVARHEHERAAALYCGNLLDGIHVHDAPEYEEWLLVRREHLRTTFIFELRDLVSIAYARHNYRAGLQYAYRILECDSWNEEAHRDVMRLLALSGAKSAALAQFETCKRILKTELNTEPTSETMRLVHLIQNNGLR